MKNIYLHIMQDSLYRNSVYLMASTLVTACFGFFFWILNARFFPPEQIGIATTILSASTILTQLGLLGFKNGIIRYLPKSTAKNNKINTVYNITVLFTLLLSVLYIVSLPILSSHLLFLRNNSVYFFLFAIVVISFVLNQIQEGIFVAYRSTGYILIKNAVWGIAKLTLPFFLYSMGAFGVFLAFSFGSIISYMVGMYYLTTRFQYTFSPAISTTIVKQIGRFSIGDYIGIFFVEVPHFLVPIIIINYLGAAESAYYYIVLQIATLLYIIPGATTQSLFAEGSQSEEDIKHHLKKACMMIFGLMIPAVLITTFLGTYVLRIFGNVYNEHGLQLLQLLGVAGIFFSINSIGSTIVHVKRKIHLYVLLNFISAVVTIFFSFFFVSYGLVGIGYAWLIGYGVTSLLYIFFLRRMLW